MTENVSVKAPKTKPAQPTIKTPAAWVEELSEKYRSAIAHAFLFHGNVNDYVGGIPGESLKHFLVTWNKDRTLVVSWNRATGFVLPTKKQRLLFAELANLPLPATSSGRGPGGSIAAGVNQYAQAQRSIADVADTLSLIRKPEDALNILSRVLHARPDAKRLQQPGDEQEEAPNAKAQESFRVAVILDYAETIVPASEAAASESDRQSLVHLASWGRDAAIGDQGHILYLIANDLHDLNERLRKSSARWEPISIPFPSLDERAAFLNRLLGDANLDVELASDTDLMGIARLTTGLRYVDLEDIVLRANFLGQPLSPALVKGRKNEIMRSEFDEVLSIQEHEFGFEALGGMEEIKNDLRTTVIAPMRNGNLRVVPQGILLMGPAGTGKTRLARALAKEAGVTFVELQPAKIYSRWIGDTEGRLERALAAISAWRPCIVFIDEIDQAMARGEGNGGDNGVSNRVFKRLMEVMSDTALRGHVLFIAATNRPDLLDPALRRPGRLDKKVPILPPDTQERAAILSVLTQVAFPGEEKAWPTTEAYQQLATQMERYTGAEIEGIVGKAAQLRAVNSFGIAEALAEAFDRILPTTQQIEDMTRLALLYCNDLDLVPKEHRTWARELRKPQAEAPEEDQSEEMAPRRRAVRRDW